jgi:hypothetical protein
MGSLRKALPLLAAVLALTGTGTVRGDDPLDGELEIRSAYAVPSHGVIMLSASVAYPSSELLTASLKDGVTLSFDLECIITRHRRLWFDAQTVDLVRHRELTYHVVTDRYLLRDVERRAGFVPDAGSRARSAGRRSRNGRSRSNRSCTAMGRGRSRCAPACAAATCPMRCAR